MGSKSLKYFLVKWVKIVISISQDYGEDYLNSELIAATHTIYKSYQLQTNPKSVPSHHLCQHLTQVDLSSGREGNSSLQTASIHPFHPSPHRKVIL